MKSIILSYSLVEITELAKLKDFSFQKLFGSPVLGLLVVLLSLGSDLYFRELQRMVS